MSDDAPDRITISETPTLQVVRDPNEAKIHLVGAGGTSVVIPPDAVDAVTDALQTIQDTPVDTKTDFTELIHQRMIEADDAAVDEHVPDDGEDDGRTRCPDCGAPLRQSLGGKQCPECRWSED